MDGNIWRRLQKTIKAAHNRELQSKNGGAEAEYLHRPLMKYTWYKNKTYISRYICKISSIAHEIRLFNKMCKL